MKSDPSISTRRGPYANSLEHVLAELTRIDALIRGRVKEARVRSQPEDPYRGLYISEADVDGMLDAPFFKDERPSGAAMEGVAEVARINAERSEATGPRQEGYRLLELQRAFELTPLDLDIVLLCLAPELSLQYERFFAYLQDDVTKRQASVDLTLKILCRDFSERIAAFARFYETAPLRRAALIELLEDAASARRPLLARCFRLDPRITRYLLDSNEIDERLLVYVEHVEPQDASQRIQEHRALRDFIERSTSRQKYLTFRLFGGDAAARRQWAEATCWRQNIAMLAVDGEALAAREGSFSQMLALIVREAALLKAAIFWEGVDVVTPGRWATRGKLIETLISCGRIVFFSGEDAPLLGPAEAERAAPPTLVTVPTTGERARIWRRELGETAAPEILKEIAPVAAKFRLGAGEISAAAASARAGARWRANSEEESALLTSADVYASCRDRSNPRIAQLARTVAPRRSWTDLVLPADALRQLRELCDRVRFQAEVMETWGFEGRLSLGRGASALFSGPSGVGKTMAAEVIAGELGLDLYKIDLSGIVSKYIGETEKNLARVFREAENCSAILFFDEADALFGKRSEVQDAHDRYANVETSYLLQRMEEYQGISILATNLRRNMDDAFTRRIAHIVQFPFPEAPERLLIWKGAFPIATPLSSDIDLEFMADTFRLPGASIANIAVAAAFFAASEGDILSMRHLVRATYRELQKLGKSASISEFGVFAVHLEV